MGMPIVFEICDPEVGPEPVQRAIEWLEWVNIVFSTYRADSQISRLNRGEVTVADLDPAVGEILARSEELRRATDGYFDIRAPYAPGGEGPQNGRGGPGSVDPSGLVKGWAVKRAVELLVRAGGRNLAVNAGGDVLVSGHPDGDSAWRIGIQHPRSSRDIALTLAVSDRAVATSGAYIRGDHILDPHTGAAPGDLLSVTITGPDLSTADAYATAVFAMGAERGAWWCARLDGYDAVLIRDDDTVLTTPGIEQLRV